MRVLLTGAGGSLGRVLANALSARGDTVRLLDARRFETPHELVVADIRDAYAVRAAADGMDAVVHGAAVHGIHVATWPPAEFWSINATGTFNVYDAARLAGVRHVVLCSTMAVYGRSAEATDDAWATVYDSSPVEPLDVYGVSKHVCETLAADAARCWSITTVALRLGMFVPETFERYGFRLLFGGVDDRDVADACLLALDHRPTGGFDTFNIFAAVPFTTDDAAMLADDAAGVVERYWPGTVALARARGADVDDLIWGWAVWSVEKARTVLGFQPVYGFGEFLEAWRRDDRGFYPFADATRWGV
jgi:nucleoside-diphosphate-sugar epimerase